MNAFLPALTLHPYSSKSRCDSQYSCRNQAWLLKNSLFIPIGQNLGDGKCLGDPRKSILELPDAILFSSILREGVFQQPLPITLTTPVAGSRLVKSPFNRFGRLCGIYYMARLSQCKILSKN
jgi:hypothetical protein